MPEPRAAPWPTSRVDCWSLDSTPAHRLLEWIARDGWAMTGKDTAYGVRFAEPDDLALLLLGLELCGCETGGGALFAHVAKTAPRSGPVSAGQLQARWAKANLARKCFALVSCDAAPARYLGLSGWRGANGRLLVLGANPDGCLVLASFSRDAKPRAIAAGLLDLGLSPDLVRADA